MVNVNLKNDLLLPTDQEEVDDATKKVYMDC